MKTDVADGWDDPESEPSEASVSDFLTQVGADVFPVHPVPEALTEREVAWHRRRWGRGEPVVTPRLRASLAPGELEAYAGALERRLRYYAWSRVENLGTALIDAEALVQDALIDRWGDPRELDDSDTERFAIRLIASRAVDAHRKADHRADMEEDFDCEAGAFITRYLPESSLAWIRSTLSEAAAQAVALVVEQQYTHEEAAAEVGLRREAVTHAFTRLRNTDTKYSL